MVLSTGAGIGVVSVIQSGSGVSAGSRRADHAYEMGLPIGVSSSFQDLYTGYGISVVPQIGDSVGS